MAQVKNVLVVDDDPVFRLIAKKLFEKSDGLFNGMFAENGKEAIKLLNTVFENPDEVPAPDIIFLDIEMPVMNGWEFMDEFVKFPEEKIQNIRVYYVSSSIAEEDKNRTASYSQIKGYVSKPLTIHILKNIAENIALQGR